jgi:hypothetical protein
MIHDMIKGQLEDLIGKDVGCYVHNLINTIYFDKVIGVHEDFVILQKSYADLDVRKSIWRISSIHGIELAIEEIK